MEIDYNLSRGIKYLPAKLTYSELYLDRFSTEPREASISVGQIANLICWKRWKGRVWRARCGLRVIPILP